MIKYFYVYFYNMHERSDESTRTDAVLIRKFISFVYRKVNVRL